MNILVVPILGSMLAAFVLPRLIAPLYLKIATRGKGVGTIDSVAVKFNFKQFLGRAINCWLLLCGLFAVLLPMINENGMAALFMHEDTYLGHVAEGHDTAYTTDVIIGIMALVTPLTIGLYSIGWSLQDQGMSHFTKEGKFPRIVPVHENLVSFLKGYGGISTALFAVELVMMFATRPGWAGDAVTIIVSPILLVGEILLGYLVYVKAIARADFLKKGAKRMKPLEESDIFEKA